MRRFLKPKIVVPVAAVIVALLVFVLVYFEPHTAFIDDSVNEAAPAGETSAATQVIGLEHGASGSVVIVTDEDGGIVVRFVDLDASNGPDLKVYLSTNPVDGPAGAFDDEAIDLGALKGNIGSQNYDVSPGVDLADYRSVVIWCDRFDTPFAAAPLPTVSG